MCHSLYEEDRRGGNKADHHSDQEHPLHLDRPLSQTESVDHTHDCKRTDKPTERKPYILQGRDSEDDADSHTQGCPSRETHGVGLYEWISEDTLQETPCKTEGSSHGEGKDHTR